MRISLEYPDEFDQLIMQRAEEDGHQNRSAVIRKAISFFLSRKSHKVNFEENNKSNQKRESNEQ